MYTVAIGLLYFLAVCAYFEHDDDNTVEKDGEEDRKDHRNS